MRIIVSDKRLAQWAADRMPHVGDDGFSGHFEALGVFDGASILAVMVLHDYIPAYSNAQISMAADTAGWATKDMIRQLMAYPFHQLGLNRVTTMTPARNERALRFNRGIGFKQEGVIRSGFGNDDCVIMGLLKSEAPDWMLRQ